MTGAASDAGGGRLTYLPCLYLCHSMIYVYDSHSLYSNQNLVLMAGSVSQPAALFLLGFQMPESERRRHNDMSNPLIFRHRFLTALEQSRDAEVMTYRFLPGRWTWLNEPHNEHILNYETRSWVGRHRSSVGRRRAVLRRRLLPLGLLHRRRR